jgi:hypothetical protein
MAMNWSRIDLVNESTLNSILYAVASAGSGKL